MMANKLDALLMVEFVLVARAKQLVDLDLESQHRMEPDRRQQ
jgi:hypothetical protein